MPCSRFLICLILARIVACAAAAALFGMGTANAFDAFFLLPYKIENNGAEDQKQNSGSNIVSHRHSPLRMLGLQLFVRVANQTNDNQRKDQHGNETCDCGSDVERAASH